ncbi:MAG: hypothetical protein WBW16_04620 [Bacteroidota bacterium]
MKTTPFSDLIKKLNSFATDNYWELGKFIVEKVMPTARKQGMFEDEVLKDISSQPGIKFPYAMLKQCQQFYSYYPEVTKLPLPEIFYFDLATKIPDSTKRREYEKLALKFHWTISELRKRMHDDEVTQREMERTKYGFDLKDRNVWSFEAPDLRFGKSGFKGRLPGQILANALFYHTEPGAVVVDPFAGSGTLGDVVDVLPYFGNRKYKLYDIEPVDPRIARHDVLKMGIPEQSDSVDYVFLDPPVEFYSAQAPDGTEQEPSVAMADFLLKFKGLVRETHRVLKPGGKVSAVVEPAFTSKGFLDFSFELTKLFNEQKFKTIGKVYLPRRSGGGVKKLVSAEAHKQLASDCRELLTFQKSG